MTDATQEAIAAIEAERDALAARVTALEGDVRRWKATSDDHFRNAQRLAGLLASQERVSDAVHQALWNAARKALGEG